MDMNEGRGFIHQDGDKNANMSIEDVAAEMLLSSREGKKYLAYINARVDRDKLVNAICKNIDGIQEITEKHCDLDTQIAIIDVCINMLDNIMRLQMASYHVGFMTDSALALGETGKTTDTDANIDKK